MGHRGLPLRYPDNSLAGLMAGVAAVGAVELDVRLTADGHLILSHEADHAGLPISSSATMDLLAVDPRPCLLDEVLALPGRLNLEVKNIPGDGGFDPYGRVALLTASRARATDLITSFYWADMDLVRARVPDVSTGLVVGEGGPIRDALTHARHNGHQAVSAHHELLEREVCAESERGGVALLAWTVASVDRARELSEMGVAAIISDDPLVIRNGLRECER